MNWFREGDPALVLPEWRVGLLVGLRPPAHWGDSVRSLAGYAEAVVADPLVDDMDAWLASSSDAPGLERARATGKPVVVLEGDGSLTTGVDARAIPPVTPFVRARWRRRFGLPPDLVVDAAEIPDDLRSTALAVVAAVVAIDADMLLEALAWGAPCVTDPAGAEAVGARDEVEVLVGDADDARALAADERRAARLGRAGRRLVERRHDPVQVAVELRRSLGLTAGPPPVTRALDELWTPPDARIRRRAAKAAAL